MSPREPDDELEEYLEGDSELSRLYRRDAHETPDASLDARIRAEAHRVVAGHSGLVRSPFARHWLVPTSIAAVLVLSVSVVLLVPDATLEPPLVPAGKPERAVTPGQAPSAIGAPLPAEALKRREQSSASEAADERALSTPRRASPDSGEADHADRADKLDEGVDRSADAPLRMRAAEPAAQEKAASGSAESVPAAPAAESMPAAPAAGRAAAQGAPATAADEARAARPAAGALAAQAVQADPAAWLRFIERLVGERDTAAARSNVRAFRARYPDYPLPAHLLTLTAPVEAQRP